MPVVDASVFVALFHAGDPAHPASRRWLAQSQGKEEPIVAPVLLLAEVAAALSRGVGDPDLAREAVRLLRGRWLVELFPVTETLAARAAEIAAEQKIRGCDSIYVALARLLEMDLVTEDRQQIERGGGVVVTRRP